MLIRLVFKPSTYKALDKEGKLGMEMVPFPTTLFLDPSPKVTNPHCSMTRVSKKLCKILDLCWLDSIAKLSIFVIVSCLGGSWRKEASKVNSNV